MNNLRRVVIIQHDVFGPNTERRFTLHKTRTELADCLEQIERAYNMAHTSVWVDDVFTRGSLPS